MRKRKRQKREFGDKVWTMEWNWFWSLEYPWILSYTNRWIPLPSVYTHTHTHTFDFFFLHKSISLWLFSFENQKPLTNKYHTYYENASHIMDIQANVYLFNLNHQTLPTTKLFCCEKAYYTCHLWRQKVSESLGSLQEWFSGSYFPWYEQSLI